MVKPLHDYVLIQTLEDDMQTKSGIIIPDTSKEQPVRGKVVAIADEYVKDGVTYKVSVEVNDVIIFNKYAGTKINYNDEKYLLIHDIDILAVIN